MGNEGMSIEIKNKKYEIIKILGQGEFRRVILVKNKSDNKLYVIKEIIIKDDMKDKIKDITKEADILSKFNCKNIIKYYDSYLSKDKFYILMEYCNGGNLRDFINNCIKNGVLIQQSILYQIIKQICIGIKEIHNKIVIHGDIKPENIFINKKMEIKIGNFSKSKQLNPNKVYTQTLNEKESIEYIAPETLIKGISNEKSDMYSLGCIIYELLNLRKYYNDKTMNEIKKIDTDIYNIKWQEIINSLLEIDNSKRMNINEVLYIIFNELNKNIIIGEIYINKEDINKDIRIINSFENMEKKWSFANKDDYLDYANEKEIKENIEIKINGKIIDFAYYHKFEKEGKYIIEYRFKNNLTKINHMFNGCDSLINLDLSNFNSQNVTNMIGMFSGCKSLAHLNLSNLKTQNITNIDFMFASCDSLKKENIITKDNKILEEFDKKI